MALTPNQINARLRALITLYPLERELVKKAVAYIRAAEGQERADRKEACQAILADALSDLTAHQRLHYVRQMVHEDAEEFI